MKAKKISVLVISGLLVLLFSTTTWARDQVQNRQYNKRNPIEQGLQSGKITKREMSQLKKDQQQIRQYTRRAVRDGEVTRYEKRTISRMQNRADRHVYIAKNNRNHRYYDNSYQDRKHHYHGDALCYRAQHYHYRGYYPFASGFYFSGTWLDPGGFFSFSTGSKW